MALSALEQQIKDEEEKLAQLADEDENEAKAAASAEEDGDDDTEEEDEETEENTEADANDEDDNEDTEEEDGDDDTEEEDEPDAKKAKAKDSDSKEENPNAIAAKRRIEQRNKMREKMAANNAPAPFTATPAQETQEEAKELTAEQRLERLEAQREQDQLQREALTELENYENQFKQNNDIDTVEYEAAAAHMQRVIATSIANLNPGLTRQQLIDGVKQTILHHAGTAVKQGVNPAEYLYHMAYDTYKFGGVTENTTTENEETKDANTVRREAAKKKIRNARKTAKNKKRSANAFSGAGRNGKAGISAKQAADMTQGELNKLSSKEFDDLIAAAALEG